ncbi:MAG: hypothetical protein WB566_17185 [Terriglobales bacterium]
MIRANTLRFLWLVLMETAQDLAPHFNAYFMFINGYSSSATRLGGRPKAELHAALPKLKKSFFDLHPRYKPLMRLISVDETPALLRYMQIADKERMGLVTLIEAICLGPVM